MSSASTTLMVFSGEKGVFRREYKAGYYGIFAYYASKVLMELPFSIVSPIITVSIAYFMIGLRPGFSHFAINVFTDVLTSMVAYAMGILLGAVFPDFQASMTFFPMLILPLMIFGGLMTSIKNIPKWFFFMPYISPLKYAFTAVLKNEFEDAVFPNCIPDGQMPCTGNAGIVLLGLDREPSIYVNWLVLLLMYGTLILLGFFALWRTISRR